MKQILISALVLFACMVPGKGTCQQSMRATSADSIRIAELNQYWAEVSRTVRQGDFEGYKSTYHRDAVCVFTTGTKKSSSPIDEQLKIWKPGFVDTKSGKTRKQR